MSGLRIGLAGTGYWAATTHAVAAAASPWHFAAVWGRNGSAAERVAAETSAGFGTDDFDRFLDSVDAVVFALPPAVQAELGLRALRAGKHVLLEKPVSIDDASARLMVEAAAEQGVAALVFFTMLYDPRMRAIIANTREWKGATGLWLGSALNDENPFNTPWRHVKGGLWDLGPHALSVTWRTVGPIVDVTAERGAADLVHLVLRHENGATSTASLTLRAPDAADGFSTTLWGDSGRQELPVDDVDSLAAATVALEELYAAATDGSRSHLADLTLGRDIVAILERAEKAIEAAE